MKINDILNLVLEQKYSVCESELDYQHSLIVNMINSDCQLHISCPNYSTISFRFRYSEDATQKGIRYSPYLNISDIEEVKPFLNALFKEVQKDYNNILIKKDLTQKHKNIINLFKLILAEQPIPKEYSFKFNKNKKNSSGVIHLTEKSTGNIYNVDFHHLDLAYLPKRIVSPITNMRIFISPSFKNKVMEEKFCFVIPGYDLHRYPLLDYYNKIPKAHTDTDMWINDLINSPEIGINPVFPGIKSLMLNEELSNEKPVIKKHSKI